MNERSFELYKEIVNNKSETFSSHSSSTTNSQMRGDGSWASLNMGSSAYLQNYAILPQDQLKRHYHPTAGHNSANFLDVEGSLLGRESLIGYHHHHATPFKPTDTFYTPFVASQSHYRTYYPHRAYPDAMRCESLEVGAHVNEFSEISSLPYPAFTLPIQGYSYNANQGLSNNPHHSAVLVNPNLGTTVTNGNVSGNRPSIFQRHYPEDLEKFAEDFKQKRIKLGVTQADVGNALAKLKIIGVGALSQSTICRFESLTLSLNNMIALKPILEAWLSAAENEMAQRRMECNALSVKQEYCLEKKRKRTSITTHEKKSLESFFLLHPRPSGEKISHIASKLDLKKNVVRVWFCNQRQKQKRMKFSSNSTNS